MESFTGETPFPRFLPPNMVFRLNGGNVIEKCLAIHLTLHCWKPVDCHNNHDSSATNTPTLLVSQETFTQLFGSEHAHNRLVIKLKEGLSDRDYATIVDTTRSL